jgi:hypothetical protein
MTARRATTNPRLSFSVFQGGRRIAAFEEELGACLYAQHSSRLFFTFTEVALTRGSGRGLVAQYRWGESTPEFAVHEQAREAAYTPSH